MPEILWEYFLETLLFWMKLGILKQRPGLILSKNFKIWENIPYVYEYILVVTFQIQCTNKWVPKYEIIWNHTSVIIYRYTGTIQEPVRIDQLINNYWRLNNSDDCFLTNMNFKANIRSIYKAKQLSKLPQSHYSFIKSTTHLISFSLLILFALATLRIKRVQTRKFRTRQNTFHSRKTS